MGFGSLSSAHQIMVLLSLKGGPEYAAQMEAAAAETGGLGKALLTTSAAMDTATKRSWLHNQALFTARRYAFYATLAVTALAYEVFKLGMSYNSTVQSARVALKGMFDTRTEMNATIKSLYQLSTFSPFLFKDTLTAFRTMAPALKNAGIGPTQTLKTMHAVMDALAQSGRTSTGALTRVGVQLQHLANIGRPTGQIILALARDGLPVYPAFRKELGLTGTSLEQMGSSGITAAQAIDALNKFIETSPIYKNQAFLQATKTLQGNWMMFKDILAQAAGGATGGLFSGLTKRLQEVNSALRSNVLAGKNVGLTQIFQALNQGFTPNSNLIINSFTLFATVLHTVAFELSAIAKGIGWFIGIIDYIPQKLGVSTAVMKLFGFALGSIVTLFVIGKAVLFPFILMLDLWKSTFLAAKGVYTAFQVVQAIVNGEWALAARLIGINTEATAANTTVQESNNMSLAQKSYLMGAMGDSIAASTVATDAGTSGLAAFGAGFTALLGPIGLVIAALTTYIMFQKQINSFGVKHLNLDYNKRHPQKPTTSNLLKDIFVNPWENIYHNVRSSDDPFKSSFWPHFASGGTTSGGPVLVGENGPELLNPPAGTQVTPLGRNAFNGSGALAITIIPQDIYLDGQKIASVLANVVTNKEARMQGRNV